MEPLRTGEWMETRPRACRRRAYESEMRKLKKTRHRGVPPFSWETRDEHTNTNTPQWASPGLSARESSRERLHTRAPSVQ